MSEIIFKRLDEHNATLIDLRIEQGIQKARLDQMEKQHSDICEQLIATRTELMALVTKISNKQDEIMQEQSKSEGAKSAYKTIPVILGLVVVILQIYQLVGKH